MHTTSAYFNNVDLNTLPGVKIVNHNVSELPRRVLNSNKLARANRSILTSAEYVEKFISITGFVGGADLSETQLNFDRLKGRVQTFEGLVRVSQGNTQVEYTGTLNGLQKEMVGPNIRFVLEFKCSNPIGRDVVGSALFSPLTITTASATHSFTVGGSFRARPRFTLVVNSVTGGTSDKSISVLDAATNKGIRVTRDWDDGDILSINADTFEVIVNSSPVDFDGQFPEFQPGGRTLQYIDDFSTRNVTLSSIYQRQYS